MLSVWRLLPLSARAGFLGRAHARAAAVKAKCSVVLTYSVLLWPRTIELSRGRNQGGQIGLLGSQLGQTGNQFFYWEQAL